MNATSYEMRFTPSQNLLINHKQFYLRIHERSHVGGPHVGDQKKNTDRDANYHTNFYIVTAVVAIAVILVVILDNDANH